MWNSTIVDGLVLCPLDGSFFWAYRQDLIYMVQWDPDLKCFVDLDGEEVYIPEYWSYAQNIELPPKEITNVD